MSFADSKLAHTSFTPSIHLSIIAFAIIDDCEGVERTRCDVGHIEDVVHSTAFDWIDDSLMEEFDELRGSCDLNGLREAELAFVTTSPRVKVALISHDHRVALTASNHSDTLIPQGLQDLRFLGRSGTSVTRDTLVSTTHAENVTISGQVKRVILAAGDR